MGQSAHTAGLHPDTTVNATFTAKWCSPDRHRLPSGRRCQDEVSPRGNPPHLHAYVHRKTGPHSGHKKSERQPSSRPNWHTAGHLPPLRLAIKQQDDCRSAGGVSRKVLRVSPDSVFPTVMVAKVVTSYAEGEIRTQITDKYPRAHGAFLCLQAPEQNTETELFQYQTPFLDTCTTRTAYSIINEPNICSYTSLTRYQ